MKAAFSHIRWPTLCIFTSTYNACDVIYDLHSHTTASDGSLDPDSLVSYAAECGVDVLAITDHDTLDAFDQIDGSAPGIQLITGVELSTTWNRIGIHVVGLDVDPHNRMLRNGVNQQKAGRIERARIIAGRLRKLGVPDPLDDVLEIAGGACVGRPHFAEHLVATGVCRDTKTAFRKYLGAGKAGDVREGWATLKEVVQWISSAGGTAVLAHPMKYGLTKSKTRALAIDFRNAGGRAIEVVCGSQPEATTNHLARLATELGLAASCGSDFHDPGLAWSRPGAFPPLPASVSPVWETWQTPCI